LVGCTASAVIEVLSRPLLDATHVPAASVLLNTPPPSVPA
jgi:hypothetical protein